MSFLIIASLLSGYVSQGNDYIYRQLKETNPLERTMFSLSPKVSHAFFMSLLWPLFMCLNAAPQLRFIQFFICFLGCFLSSIIPFGIMFLLNLLIKQPLYIASIGVLFSIIRFIIMLCKVDKLSTKSQRSSLPCEKHRSIKEASETLDYFSQLFDSSFFDRTVRKEIEEIIKRDFDEFTDAFDPIEGKAKEWVTSQISNISGDLLETGRYCVYRGVLSFEGENLWKFYSVSLDELLKLNVLSQDGKKIDQEWINNQKRILRKHISEVG